MYRRDCSKKKYIYESSIGVDGVYQWTLMSTQKTSHISASADSLWIISDKYEPMKWDPLTKEFQKMGTIKGTTISPGSNGRTIMRGKDKLPYAWDQQAQEWTMIDSRKLYNVVTSKENKLYKVSLRSKKLREKGYEIF